MNSFSTSRIDFTFITLLLGFITYYIKNNQILNISTISILIAVCIMGNILSFSYTKTVADYYKTTTKTTHVVNVVTHIIIPIYLINVISKNTDFNLNTKQLISIVIFTHVFMYSYYILLCLGFVSGYGLPSLTVFNFFALGTSFIVLIVLYLITSYINY